MKPFSSKIDQNNHDVASTMQLSNTAHNTKLILQVKTSGQMLLALIHSPLTGPCFRNTALGLFMRWSVYGTETAVSGAGEDVRHFFMPAGRLTSDTDWLRILTVEFTQEKNGMVFKRPSK